MSRLLAFAYDYSMRKAERADLRAWRTDLLAGLHGRVLEVGAGTGANLGLYPEAVTELVVTEPDPHMRRKLRRRHAVDATEAQVESLPFSNGSFDAVVCTLVLCSVSDPARALTEIRRVLKPAGKLVFIEHVAADDEPARLAWQRRIEPVWKVVAAGCHTTRRTADAISTAGFDYITLDRAPIRGALPWVRPAIRGTARKSA